MCYLPNCCNNESSFSSPRLLAHFDLNELTMTLVVGVGRSNIFYLFPYSSEILFVLVSFEKEEKLLVASKKCPAINIRNIGHLLLFRNLNLSR